MKVVICSVALGGWYPKGISRLINEFARHGDGLEIQGWVNVLPPGAPAGVVEDGYDYTAYCAKPYALMSAMVGGADIAILLDCAFYPIRSIHPLIDHITRTGYYFCKNGAPVGAWSSDRCLERMGTTRDDAMTMEEISSYCVGLNFRHGNCIELVQRWCGFAGDRLTVPGRHTNTFRDSPPGRNMGWCSDDPRCKGHRHDQTVLSILAHRMGMRELTERPKFTAYKGSENDTTVLVNQGM